MRNFRALKGIARGVEGLYVTQAKPLVRSLAASAFPLAAHRAKPLQGLL